jgi:hypothetical protein
MIKRISKYVIPTDKDDESDDSSSFEETNLDREDSSIQLKTKQSIAKEIIEKINLKESIQESKENLINRKTEREVKINQK